MSQLHFKQEKFLNYYKTYGMKEDKNVYCTI